jgi:hypothetical protein
VCRIILTYETAAARSVVTQKRGFPAHFVIRQGQVVVPHLADALKSVLKEWLKSLKVIASTLAPWERAEREPTGAFAASAKRFLAAAEAAWKPAAARTV